mgnify:CR=1 FL=1
MPLCGSVDGEEAEFYPTVQLRGNNTLVVTFVAPHFTDGVHYYPILSVHSDEVEQQFQAGEQPLVELSAASASLLRPAQSLLFLLALALPLINAL